MNISHIIKAHLPEGTELPEKILAAMAKDINKAMGEEMIPKEWYSKKTKEWELKQQELEAALSETQAAAAEHASLKAALEEAQKARESEIAAHKATREGYAAKEEGKQVDAMVEALLTEAKLNSSVLPKAMKLYDRSMVKRGADGGIENAEELLDLFHAEWDGFFGEVSCQGADVGKPIAGKGMEKDPFLSGFDR